MSGPLRVERGTATAGRRRSENHATPSSTAAYPAVERSLVNLRRWSECRSRTRSRFRFPPPAGAAAAERRHARHSRIGYRKVDLLVSSYDLPSLGWDDQATAAFSAVAHPDDVPGRVARVDTGVVTVLTAGGVVRASWGARLLAAAADDATAAPGTRDWVGLRLWPDERTTVEVVLPRRTALRGRSPRVVARRNCLRPMSTRSWSSSR